MFFSPSNSNSGIESCGKIFFCCQYIKESIEHTFPTVSKKVELNAPFYCESKNLISVIIFSGYIEETTRQPMHKERLNTCREHIQQPKLQQIDIEGQLRTCGCQIFKIVSLFQFGKITKSQESHMKHMVKDISK